MVLQKNILRTKDMAERETIMAESLNSYMKATWRTGLKSGLLLPVFQTSP